MKSKLRRSDLLTTDEIASLMVACKRLHQRALIELLLESGCRLGEALNLTLRDIEHENEFLLISVDGKTGPRTIPALKSNLPVFLLYIQHMKSGKVFPFSKSAIIRQMRRIYKNAKVKRSSRPSHVFRHMKCEYLLEAGTPEVIIRKFMGWSENSNMVSYYSHLNVKAVKDYFSRLYGIDPKPQSPLYPPQLREEIKHLLE